MVSYVVKVDEPKGLVLFKGTNWGYGIRDAARLAGDIHDLEVVEIDQP